MSEKLRNQVNDPALSPFERLVTVLAILRSEEGCAWDRKQTHLTLLPYLVEEAYEVIEAVETENKEALCEELGDLVCQVVFHAQLASEAGHFTVNDSLQKITEKLIHRHPHVFGEKKDLNPKEVRDQWEKIKVESGEKKSVLAGLPQTMPALVRAYRIGEKAGGVGFDWHNANEVLEKIDEEMKELKQEIFSGNSKKQADEIGDLLFAVASLSRKLEINPEMALRAALDKFSSRFALLEEELNRLGKKFSEMNMMELEKIWQQVK